MAEHKRIEIGKYLVVDSKICHGQLTFKGTRVMVSPVLRALQRGESWDEIRQDWPTVPDEAIQEALELAIEKLVDSYEFEEDEFEEEFREAV
ncbi:DUF433 domain-containing protein [bacterium]|nr:DUF433 domain-containing protein [bacterium]